MKGFDCEQFKNTKDSSYYIYEYKIRDLERFSKFRYVVEIYGKLGA